MASQGQARGRNVHPSVYIIFEDKQEKTDCGKMGILLKDENSMCIFYKCDLEPNKKYQIYYGKRFTGTKIEGDPKCRYYARINEGPLNTEEFDKIELRMAEMMGDESWDSQEAWLAEFIKFITNLWHLKLTDFQGYANLLISCATTDGQKIIQELMAGRSA